MKQFIILSFFLIPAFIWSQSDTARFVIRTYGFQSWDDYDEIQDSIAGNWDIMYLPVAGCVVTDEFVDSIERLNELTYGRLEKHYGYDWKERFDKTVDSAYRNILYQKENTFQETSNCSTENFSLKVSENLSQTKLKFTIYKKTHDSNNTIRIIGLQHIDPTILYRGYENLIALEFSAFDDTSIVLIKSKSHLSITDTCLTSARIQFSHRVSGSAKTDTLLIETSDGQTYSYIFNIKNLESPQLYFNNLILDSTIKISDLTHESVLSMHYDKTCLVPDRFTIHTWEVSYSENKRFVGRGSIIPISVIRKLRKLKPGSKCSISITVSTPDSILRKKIVDFILI